MIEIRLKPLAIGYQLSLPVHLTPKSGRDGFISYSPEMDALRIRIRAVPEDGKANVALLRFFAKQCAIPKSSVELLSGHQSRHKRLSVTLEHEHRLTDFYEVLGRLIGLENWRNGITIKHIE